MINICKGRISHQSVILPFVVGVSVSNSISESGLGDGAFMSGEGIGLLKVGSNSSSFFLTVLTRDPKALYAFKNNRKQIKSETKLYPTYL